MEYYMILKKDEVKLYILTWKDLEAKWKTKIQ